MNGCFARPAIKLFFNLFTLLFTLCLSAQISTYPYFEDFESGDGGWARDGISLNPSWEYGTPVGSVINRAASGNNAWVTNLDGDYNEDENSYLESPVFDLSSLTNPYIQFSIWWDTSFIDDGALLYSQVDDGIPQIVGALDSGVNWYNGQFNGNFFDGWNGSSGGWKTASNSISHLAGETNVKFLIYFKDVPNTEKEGIGFDDFLIYDRPANVSIPDAGFEQALIDAGIDTDGILNGQASETDLFNVTNLFLSGTTIANFEGLQYFTALDFFFNSNNNAVSSLDFSGNGNLEDVSINNCSNLGSVVIDKNYLLEDLTIINTNLNAIDVSNNKELLFLNLGNNALSMSGIDLSNNTKLFTANLSNNPQLQFDLPALPDLQILDVSNTQTNNIDVSFLRNLFELNVSNTNVQTLDLSYNPDLENLYANSAALQNINLQVSNEGRSNQGGGGGGSLINVDLQNNDPSLCILVNSVFDAENDPNWFKDVTATYIDTQNVFLQTSAQNDSANFEEGGIGLDALNQWIDNNGGAMVTSDCIDIKWNHRVTLETIFDDDGDFINDDLRLDVDFGYNDGNGFVVLSSAEFTLFDLPIIGFGNGTGDANCDIESYDLKNIIDVDLESADYDLSEIDVTEKSSSAGFGQGGKTSGTKVDFPDQGAGSYTYIYQVSVKTNINTSNYSSVFDSAEDFFVNEVTVTFDSGIDRIIPICPGETLSLQDLTDALKITPDLGIYPPQSGFDPNDYWFDSNDNPVTTPVGAGAYTFDPTDAFLGTTCPFTITTLTLTEFNSVSAGPNVVGNDITAYLCGDMIEFDLDDFLDPGAGADGDWILGFESIPNGEVKFPNFGAGTFSKTFEYRISASSCWAADSATYEISYTVNPRSAGEDAMIEIPQGGSVTENDLFDALGGTPNPGGVWSPTPAGVGVYTYTLAATPGCPEMTATVTVEEDTLSIEENSLDAISLYPNPTNDMFFIKGSISNLESVRIFNLSGQLINELKGSVEQIDVSSIESGMYFVKLTSSEGSKSFKLIKN